MRSTKIKKPLVEHKKIVTAIILYITGSLFLLTLRPKLSEIRKNNVNVQKFTDNFSKKVYSNYYYH